MQKFKYWVCRHKKAFLNVGIAIGFMIVFVWAIINAPVNINQMTASDWQNTKIQGIGAVTVQKLQTNAPYADMQAIDKIKGIGPAKMAQIQRHFTTWDTAKADVWFPIFFIGLLLFFGCILARYIIHKNRVEAVKKFENRLFGDDKNVKR